MDEVPMYYPQWAAEVSKKKDNPSINARLFWGDAITHQKIALPSDFLVWLLQNSKETIEALQEICRKHQVEISDNQLYDVLLGRGSLPFDDNAVCALLWHQFEIYKPVVTRATTDFFLRSTSSAQLRLSWIHESSFDAWLLSNAIPQLYKVLLLNWPKVIGSSAEHVLPLRSHAEHSAALEKLEKLLRELRLQAFTQTTLHLHCFDRELHLMLSALEADQLLASKDAPSEWEDALRALLIGVKGIVVLTQRPSAEQLQAWERLVREHPVAQSAKWWLAPAGQSVCSFSALLWAASMGDFSDYAQMRRSQLLENLVEPLDQQALDVLNQRTQRLLSEFQHSVEVHRPAKWFKITAHPPDGLHIKPSQATLEVEDTFADWLQSHANSQIKAALGAQWQLTGRAHRQLLGDMELMLDALHARFKKESL
jgi:hypothetical protein